MIFCILVRWEDSMIYRTHVDSAWVRKEDAEKRIDALYRSGRWSDYPPQEITVEPVEIPSELNGA